MRFSLIVATLSRTEELEQLLRSLSLQQFRDFECILVDQNEDERLQDIVRRWSDKIVILHLRSERGLSVARNVGLAKATGGILAFPDDDCWYPANLLRRVDAIFQESNWDFISGCAKNEGGAPTANRWLKHDAEITRSNLFRTCISFTLFIRRSPMTTDVRFDEELGVGAKTRYGSGEESDYVLKLLNLGARGTFFWDLTVHHPRPELRSDTDGYKRAGSYGYGMGRVLRTHGYSVFTLGHVLLRPLGGIVVSLCKRDGSRAIQYWLSFRARLAGYFFPWA